MLAGRSSSCKISSSCKNISTALPHLPIASRGATRLTSILAGVDDVEHDVLIVDDAFAAAFAQLPSVPDKIARGVLEAILNSSIRYWRYTRKQP